MKYIIIMPVFNEEEFIEKTILSISEQTLKPVQAIVVDDGSTDNSVEIIKGLTNKFSWITPVYLPQKQTHLSGTNVARVVNEGVSRITGSFNFIVKLDADLELPLHYFEKIAGHFAKNSRLGICGGICIIEKNGLWIEEVVSKDDHVRGAFKSYSKACFAAIGGIRMVDGWDSLDELLTLYHNFEVKVDKELKIKHFKVTDKKTGQLKAAIKSGKSAYLLGFNWTILLASVIKKAILFKPYFLSGAWMFYGYLSLRFKNVKKAVNPSEAQFINRYRFSQMTKKNNRNG